MNPAAGPGRPPRSRGVFLAASAAVLAIGAAAWIQAGADRHRGLAEQGATLARTLAEGSRTALDAVQALESSLAARLEASARRIDRALTAAPGDASALEDLRREERLARVYLFRGDGSPAGRAPVPHAAAAEAPEVGAPGERAEAAEEEDAASEARALLASPAAVAVRGLAANPFGTRTRFGVAVRRAAGRGAVLVRADAEEGRALRERVGVESLLARAAGAPGVLGVALVDPPARVLASAGPSPPPPGLPPGTLVETPQGTGLLVAAPFPAPGAGGAALAILVSTEGIDAVVARARRGILAATVAALALALGSLALLERARRRADAEEAARREREERDRRLASLGELGAGLAHEIRNPLNAIDITVQRISREVRGAGPGDAERLGEMTSTVRREVKGLDRLVDSFLRFARSPDPSLAPADLAAVVRAEAALAAPEARERGLRVEVREEPPVPPVALDAALFAQALRNLVRNALDVSPPGASVEIVVGAEEGRARVEVRDRGPGVPPADRDRVFDLFHTGREGGTGLGLPLALRSVRRHGGTIEVRDAPGGGACFVVLLPAAVGVP